MPRPRMCRRLRFKSRVNHFKPQGIPMRDLKEISISKEELEALKLKDFDDLSQTEAALKMKTSQSTFQRILSSARKKITKAIIEGSSIKIENE